MNNYELKAELNISCCYLCGGSVVILEMENYKDQLYSSYFLCLFCFKVQASYNETQRTISEENKLVPSSNDKAVLTDKQAFNLNKYYSEINIKDKNGKCLGLCNKFCLEHHKRIIDE